MIMEDSSKEIKKLNFEELTKMPVIFKTKKKTKAEDKNKKKEKKNG